MSDAADRTTVASRYVCAGCGFEMPGDELLPFRCPHWGERGSEHILTRQLDASAVRIFGGPESNPFLRYRELAHAYHVGASAGLASRVFASIVTELDGRVSKVEGHGFEATPWVSSAVLGAAIGAEDGGAVFAKDETGAVGGSHKARHLMGVMIALRIAEHLGRLPERPPLAIASCGNAALAAAVVARAAEWPIEVMIPADAEVAVVERLRELEAELVVCPRDVTVSGDPCMQRFLARVGEGALPFTVQGPQNGLVIESGATLGYELISELAKSRQVPDRLVIQVGGGALASSTLTAFADAGACGILHETPRVHTVQTVGAAPLERAYRKLTDRILSRLRSSGIEAPSGIDLEERAQILYDHVEDPASRETLAHAALHRSHYMWPWEDEPQSIAHGILDDETYDWLALVRGMIETGGYPVIANEESLHDAHELATRSGFKVSHTGAAGLAGLLVLRDAGALDPSETLGVFMTGIDRSQRRA